MKGDVYKKYKTFEYPNCIAHVYRPELTESERARRMEIIERAAYDLLVAPRKECKKT